MMPLKYMINNTDEIAYRLLSQWAHDEGSVKFFRASSNYVHIFGANGQRQFLRFSRCEERSRAKLQAELDFLLYLNGKGFRVAMPILSNQGNYIETASDEHGQYLGMVFTAAKGQCLSPKKMTNMHFVAWGKALADLHNLAQAYTPTLKRESYVDYLRAFSVAFTAWGEDKALAEVAQVERALSSLEKNENTFGLIHYDFQYDNLFWDEDEHAFWVIDFDDAHYHFYGMDIFYALSDLDGRQGDVKDCKEAFLKGYGSRRPLAKEGTILSHQWEAFERYANLMAFYRIMGSFQDSDFVSEPEWLSNLRPRLMNECHKRRQMFALHNTEGDV